MAHLKARSNYPTLLNRFIGNFSCITSRKHTYNLKYCGENGKKEKSIWERKRWVALLPCNSTERIVGIVEESKESEVTEAEGLFGNLVTEFGWRVRRLVEEEDEMRNVAQVQAEAFHIPVVFFNNLFLEFFKAEVLAALLYKIRNSPPNRSFGAPKTSGSCGYHSLEDKDVLIILKEQKRPLCIWNSSVEQIQEAESSNRVAQSL
ncbi:hypothetical protein GIB67_004520 [Kingdonia uniflora]|uniref:Uncharacterized protein n=1 Tax=Kingdonia uniflora TaxID=39325 RepID=A0A7J7NKC3_9MAGN|nr:hypothetical protein GIB67_004520 [Kingdonia uniflora]